MKQETANELRSGEHHRSRFIAAGIVTPTERDVVAIERDETVVGDGDTVGIAAEVADDLLRAAEAGLA